MIYWLIWPIGITAWLLIGWAAFFYFEAKGLRNKHESIAGYITLSYFVYTITQKMPLLIFLIGLAVGLFWGGLAVHFWAHWCPAGSVSTGMLNDGWKVTTGNVVFTHPIGTIRANELNFN